MREYIHEIRDPIHVLIRLASAERQLLDSRPLQRLRHIQQLGMTHLVYPGATHRRFEHSLGVMELAGRVYDVVTAAEHVEQETIRRLIPPADSLERSYWRRVLRLAALCHDLGHLPFSHAAEKQLLPQGWDHERLTDVLILDEEMASLWEAVKVRPADVAKLALGPEKFGPGKHRQETFSAWETILAQIIVGDAFGVDRIDYLLRDAHHSGMASGKFDHHCLINSLRILPRTDLPQEVTLGIDQEGIHAVEGLLLARYFMYSQVYFHPVRRIYDLHLRDFLKAWLPGGSFPTSAAEHLLWTDNEVTAAVLAAARSSSAAGHDAARRITQREHYRLVYQRNLDDLRVNPEAGRAVRDALLAHFKGTAVYYEKYREKEQPIVFPVLTFDGRIVASSSLSETLARVPVVAIENVYVEPDAYAKVSRWLSANRDAIINPNPESRP